MAGARITRLTLAVGALTLMAGCQLATPQFAFPKFGSKAAAAADVVPRQTAVKLVDRDIEAPEVFHVKTKAVWDGRPSLGGVWVAYPKIKAPERVIIRNPANGKFVIGALFQREQFNPGPKLQVSSDAASALGLLAGQPATLNVTALRRIQSKPPAPSAKDPLLTANKPVGAAKTAGTMAAPGGKPDKTTPSPAATAAIRPAARPAGSQHAAAPAASAAGTPAAHGAERTFLQVGIFSIEANAQRTAAELRRNGVIPTITRETSQGKTFWRVVVGPMMTRADRAAILKKVHGLNFKDAYFVTK